MSLLRRYVLRASAIYLALASIGALQAYALYETRYLRTPTSLRAVR